MIAASVTALAVLLATRASPNGNPDLGWEGTLGPRANLRFTPADRFEAGGEVALWYVRDTGAHLGVDLGMTSLKVYSELQVAWVGDAFSGTLVPGLSVGGFAGWRRGGGGVQATAWLCLLTLTPFVAVERGAGGGPVWSAGMMWKVPIGVLQLLAGRRH